MHLGVFLPHQLEVQGRGCILARSNAAAMGRGTMSAMLLLVLMPSLASGASLRVLEAQESKLRPVMKVVNMLKDMEAELVGDLEDDKQVHEMLDCWCKTNEKEKTAAIEAGEATEADLEASLKEVAAKMAEIKTKRDAAQDEVDKDWAALNEAKAMRMKDNKAYQKETTYLQDTIMAADQAIVVLSKHHPELAQVREVAHRLKHVDILSSKRLTGSQMAALKNFLEEPQAATASFLAIPGMKSYTPQSGQIFGILKQMKADFKVDLEEAEKKEAQGVKEFELIKAAKEKEIDIGKKLVLQLDEEYANLREKNAQDFKSLEDTQAQLELDTTFLANLKAKCSVSDEEFEKRVKDRLEEIAAVQDTVVILNSDTSFDAMEKTVNTPSLLQTSGSGSSVEQERAARQHRVADVLSEAASRLRSATLSLAATRAQLDAFTKVKEMIDEMVAELTKQQKDEVDHRDWCIKEMNENKLDTAAAYDKKASLETKMADLKKAIETLAEEIKASTKAIAETQESMKRSSEIREGENADFQQTISDQRFTQMILDKALARMKEVYAFLEQQPGAPHTQTSATHTDPGNGPARFTKYEKNVGGSRIVDMIEKIIGESKSAEVDAIVAEEDAQAAYEITMKQSNQMITAATKKIQDMTGARAKAKEDKLVAKGDFKETMEELSELDKTMGGLVNSCKYILDNFDARQAARAAEMDALREAKAILAGMK